MQLAENRAQLCENDLKSKQNELLVLNANLANEANKVNKLEKQIDYFKSTNTNLLDRLSDLSVVSKTGAESIKQSLEALNEQNKYIKDLTTSMQRKDSLNLVLVMNLKRSLDDFDDEDINIEVKKGVVYVSISDRMLFKSGSYKISNRAEEVIGKKVTVLVNLAPRALRGVEGQGMILMTEDESGNLVFVNPDENNKVSNVLKIS